MSFKNYKMSYLPDVLNEYRIDVSKELSIDTFLKYGFYKIADAGLKPEYRFIKNPEVNPIQYNVVKGLEEKYKSYRELIYAIVIDGRIVKIGGTYVGIGGNHAGGLIGKNWFKESYNSSYFRFFRIFW